jgi:DNA-binding CsgD family transcriptional regulator
MACLRRSRPVVFIRLLRSLMPDSKIVLVTDAHGPVDLRGAPDRSFRYAPLSSGLDIVRQPLLSPKSSSPTINDWDQLSPRERQVAICLAQGVSNKAIARLCKITEATVKTHLKGILRKTRLRNRTQAAVWAAARAIAAQSPTIPPKGP